MDLELIKIRKSTTIVKKPAKKVSQYESAFYTSDEQREENRRVLEQALIFWNNLRDVRDRANRSYQYYIGNQWDETITVKDKYGNISYVKESDYIRSNGRIPFVQNIIYSINRNIIGQYQLAPTKSIVKSRSRNDQAKSDMLSAALDEAISLNNLDILEPRQLESFLNSGVLCSGVGWKYWPERDKSDAKYEMIPLNNLIFNHFTDPRGEGLYFIGVIRDTTIEKLLSLFARSEADEKMIRGWFPNGGTTRSRLSSTAETGSGLETKYNDFYTPYDNSLCRVIETWEKRGEWRMREWDHLKGTLKTTKRSAAMIEAENLQRKNYCIDNGVEPVEELHLITYERRYEEYWYMRILNTNGECLAHGESSYEHQGSPFVITAHPLLNGRIWSLNETLIDSQRQVNRLLSLQDAILGGAAKNLLIIPEDALEGEYASTIEEITEEYSRINGTIILNLKPGAQLPMELSGKATSLGIQDMVNNYIQLILQISGVSQAIQGQKAYSGTPSSLYAQEAQNSQINIADIFATYRFHKQLRDAKALRVIKQFRKDSPLHSNRNNKEPMVYKSEEVRSLKDVDVVVTQAVDTPVYRSITDDRLSMFLEKGLIDLKTLAELSSEPWAEPLLEIINKEQSQQQQITPEQAAQLQAIQGQIQAGDQRTPEQQQLVAQAMGRTQ